MQDEDPMTRPRETTRRSERIPERESPEHARVMEREAKDRHEDRRHAAKAVRQDSGVLGDVSPRDETAR